MLDAATYPALRVATAPVMPVEKLVLGKTVEEAADLLPRLFNLCRTAQSLAARAAFGLPLEPDWQAALRQEILRDHVVKLCVKWPGLLGRTTTRLPAGWQAQEDVLRARLFGPMRYLPESYSGFQRFLKRNDGIAPVLRGVRAWFVPHVGCRGALPMAVPVRMFDPQAQENSPAARRSGHTVLQAIAARYGRGPFWSAVAVAYDLEAILTGALPEPHLRKGYAVVPAARGLYAIRAQVEEGRVRQFQRITPTDHLLCQGGALEQSVASLPAQKAQALAPLLLSILDPCYPIRLEPQYREETLHA